MSLRISGRLDSTPPSQASFAECRVEVFFEMKAPAASKGRASTRTDRLGGFEIALPDARELASNGLRFSVSAPSGRTIADVSYDVNPVENVVLIPVNTQYLEPILLNRSTDLLKVPAQRIAAQVVDRQGKPLPSNLKVLLLARRRGEQDSPVRVTR